MMRSTLCWFGFHSPVGAGVSLPSCGEYKLNRALYTGGVPFTAIEYGTILQEGRFYIPAYVDPTGQRDSTDAIQAAINAALADKRQWCEFCETLLTEAI